MFLLIGKKLVKKLKYNNTISGGSNMSYDVEFTYHINKIDNEKQRMMFEISQLDEFLNECYNAGVRDLFIGQHNIIFPHGPLHKETKHRNENDGYHRLRSPIISFYPSNKYVSNRMWSLVKKYIGEDRVYGGGHNYINIDEKSFTHGCWSIKDDKLKPVDYEIKDFIVK